MEQNILDYTLHALRGVLAIDSPTGFTDRAAAYVSDLLREMGYAPTLRERAAYSAVWAVRMRTMASFCQYISTHWELWYPR